MMSKKKIYKVHPPRRHQESVVFYYQYGMAFFERHFGTPSCRQSLYNYMIDGYPVAKGGPRVAMPVYMSVKRPKTTEEAMERFLTQVRKLEAGLKNKPLCAA